MIRHLRIAAVLILSTLALSVVKAGDCPPECKMPSPTCEQRIARAKAHGCTMPETVKIVEHTTPAPPAPPAEIRYLPAEKCQPVPCSPVYLQLPPEQKGSTFLAIGPIWNRQWGATALVGHTWANGVGLMGGPVWMPSKTYSGSVTGCLGGSGGHGHGGGYCVTAPYSADIGAQWGGQMLVSYTFR